MTTHSSILAWKIHGQRSLEGYSPLAHKTSDTTEHKVIAIVIVQPPSHVWLCDPMDCSALGLPMSHHLLKLVQVHVHCTGDVIQPSRPLMPFSPSAFSLIWAYIFNPIRHLLLAVYFIFILGHAKDII